MQLEHTSNKIQASPSRVFNFLAEVSNWEHLMPENIEHFTLTGDKGFNFQLKGMPEVRLKLDKVTPEDEVVLASNSDKFDFHLTAGIREIDSDAAAVRFYFDGQFSAVMQMMVKKPLNRFIAHLANNIERI